jgi:hypothetical protein
MKSLESQIRNLMIAIAMEQDNVSFGLDEAGGNSVIIYQLAGRRERLRKLAHNCIFNIDREIEFFGKNNYDLQ